MTTNDATNTPSAPPAEAPTSTELIRRARAGDTGAMNLIRPLFDDPQNVDTLGGNVALRSTQIVIVKMVGKDLVSEEAIQRKLELLRIELAGPNPAPLERLLVDRVVAIWLHLHKLEGEAAMAGDGDLGRALSYQRAITSAQARYFLAIRELTRLRGNVIAPMQVNIAHEQVNVINAPKA